MGNPRFALGMGSALACAMVARPADGQLVFGYATYTYNLVRYDATIGQFVTPRTMSLEVHAMAADGQGLYISCNTTLYRWLYGASGPTLIGTFSGAAPSICGGLAWDSTRGVLYGTGGANYYDQSKLVAIDPVTCVTTLVRAFPGTKMSGMDFDGPRNRLLFTQDRSAVLNDIGFYSLQWPYDTSAPVRLSPYQYSWEWDVDGVAVGGGYAWLVCDEAQWLYRYNLTTNQFETPILMSFNQHNNLSLGATWAPMMMDQVENDLSITMTGPASCTVVEGASLAMSAVARHVGGTQATTGVKVAFTVPASVDRDWVRSTPMGAWDAQGRWSVTLGTLAPEATQAVTLVIDHVPPGDVGVSAAISASQADPRPEQNAASASVRVRETASDVADGVGLGVGVLASTVAGDPSAQVASAVGGVDDPRHHGLGIGLDAAQLATIGVDGRGARGIAHSPDGTWVLAHATLASGEMLLLRFRSDGSEPARIIARAGVGPMVMLASGSYAPSRLDSAAVNNAGMIGVAMQVNGTSVLARIDEGGIATTVLEQGVTDLVAMGAGVRPTALIQSPVVGEFGQLAFVASIGGVSASVDRVILADDGSRVVAQKGVTLPFGQVDASGAATFFPARTFDEGVPGLRLSMDGSLNAWLAPGAIAASQTAPATSGVDRVLMQGFAFAGANVVAQENAVPSFGGGPLGDVEPLAFGEIDSTGNWWAGVGRRDGTSAVARNGVAYAQSGDAAWPDGPEWAGAPQASDGSQGAGQYPIVAFARAPDAGGDGATVIVGHVASSSVRRDGVAVLSGVGPVVRENEVVIGDGAATRHVGEMFAGGVSVSSRDAVVLVGLRDREAAEGCGVDALIGTALLRVPIASACPSCPADYDENGGVDGADLAAFFAEYEAGEGCADVDANGGIDGSDLATFFLMYESGGC